MASVIVSVVAALPVGFLAGMATFRKSRRWCPHCGVSLVCPDPGHSRRARAAGAGR